MRGGRLDRLIDIERATYVASDSGEPVATWAAIASRRAAGVRPVSGDERFATPQEDAKQQTEFRVRWSSEIASLNPKDRIIYPLSPATKSYAYDILAVHRIGRKEGFQIIAQRNPDIVINASTAGEPIGLLLLLTRAA